jgi:hypothetical protein
VTGTLTPAGARSAGQDAIADASDAQDARMARFSEIGMRHHFSWMIEDSSGVQQRGDVENIVIESGRRPHGLLHSLDEVRCRASLDARHTP